MSQGYAAVGPPPVIIAQPLDQVVLKNTRVTNAVLANSGTTMSYQWYKNGAPISGANANSYVIASAQTNDSGGYFVIITNAGGTTPSRTAVLTVLETNDVPVAYGDSYTVQEDTVLNVPAGGILTNDVDIYPGALQALLVSWPSKGSLVFNSDGSFSYTPIPSFDGTDTFTYRATDGQSTILEENASGGNKKEIKKDEPGAQSFRHGTNGGPTYSIGKVVLRLSRKSGQANNLNFSIGTGINSGPIAGSSYSISMASISNTTDGASFQNYDIVFSTPVGPLTAGTTYYLNLDNSPNGRDVFVEYAGSSTYPRGTYYKGGSDDSKDMRFEIHDLAVSDVATVTVNIIPVNDQPVAVNDSVVTAEDTSVSISVLANDSDVDNTLLSLVGTSTTNGTAVISGTNVVFTPATNFNGTTVFSYTVSDGGLSATGSVTVTVNPVNDPPIAVNDTTNTVEDTSVTIRVLRNDSDPEGTVLTLANVTTTNGTANITGNGTNVIFRAATNFYGTVYLDYAATDGALFSTGRVTVTVTASNDRPVAVDDTASTFEDVSVSIPVLTNDWDVDSALILSSASTTNGTATVNGSNVVFRAATNFNGTVYFNYTVSDGSLSATGRVTVTVASVNDAPIARADMTNTLEDVNVTVRVLANDYDPEGTPLVITGTFSTNGTALVSGTNVIFTPATDFNGTAVFNYTVSDGTNLVTTNVTVTVTAVNDRPVAVADFAFALEDGSVTIHVLTNDIDPEGTLLSLTGASTTNGTAVVSGTNIVFTPASHYNGWLAFSYTVFDGILSTTGYVGVLVLAVNDTPLANNDAYTTAEDVPLTISAPGILGNDTDVDGDPIFALLVTNATHGSVSLNSNGSFDYTPNTNYNGSDSFAYWATDGQAALLQQNISGESKMDIKLGQKGAQSFRHGSLGGPSYMISSIWLLLSRDAQAPNTNLNFSIGSGINSGAIAGSSVAIDPSSITNSAGNSFQFYPIFFGSPVGPLTAGTTYYLNLECEASNDTAIYAQYTESDAYANGTYFKNGTNDGKDINLIIYGNTSAEIATVTINVTPVNDAPIAINDSTNTLEDASVTIKVLLNDSDAEGTPLTIMGTSITNAVVLGTNIVFTPATDFNGTVVFTYWLSDGNGLATGVVTVAVAPVNDAPVASNNIYSTVEDVPLNILAGGILTDDSDADGDALTAVLVNGVSHGSLALNVDGSFTYTPDVDYYGSDSFTYRATDGAITGNLATVTINLTPVEDTLRFVSRTMLTNGLRLELSGPSDSTYVILGSTNFIDWIPLSTNYTALGNVVWIDPDAAGTATCFYRAMLLNTNSVLEQNINTIGLNTAQVFLGEKGAQSFQHGTAGGPGYSISKLVLHLSRSPTAPNANLSLNVGTGINSGALAGSSVAIVPSTITNTTAGLSFQIYEIVFPTPVGPLTAGTTYYLNMECEASNGRKIYLQYGQNNAYANGAYYEAGIDDLDDIWFQIWGQ